jgi:hypothetical protein
MMNPFDDLGWRKWDDETLMRDFGVKPFNILQPKAHVAGLRAVDLTRNPPEASVVARWTPILAWRHRAVPITIRDWQGTSTIYVAVGPEADREMIGRSLQECHEERVELVVALEEQVLETLTRLYGSDPDAGVGQLPI